MAHEITGKIHKIFDEKIISERFNTREFVLGVDLNTQYPQYLLLQLVNANCDLIIGRKPGDEVQCKINLKGREWNGPEGVKYFNTIECFRIYNVNAE